LNSQGSCDFGPPPFTFIEGSNIRQIKFEPIRSEWVKQGRSNRIEVHPGKLSQENIVETLKRILSTDRKPIPCGFHICKGLRQGEGLERVPGKPNPCLLSKQPEPATVCHAMLVVGYDDNFAGTGRG